MEKIWLKHYPKRHSRRDRRERVRVGARGVRGERAASSRRGPAFTCMGKTMTFAELDTLSSAFGAWLQANGCKKGTRVALMMPNILQYPVCLFGTLRAGCTVVNVNPLYTPRELEHQLERLRRRGDRRRRELREHASREVIGTHEGPAGDRDVDRRAARLQGHHRRLRAPAREEDGARVVAARLDPAVRRARRRPQAHARARAARARRHRVPAVHRRHDGRRQGRDAAAPEHRREHAAGARVADAVPRPQPARGDHHAAAAVSHLLADGELPRCSCRSAARTC